MKELIDNKKLIMDILNLFSGFHLVDVKGKIGDSDCRIQLYSSLQFALDAEEFSRFVENTQKRMTEKDGEPTYDEEENDADE